MDAEWLYLVAAILFLALLAWGFTKRPRGGGRTSTPSRNAFERFWDTPEHSETYGEHPHRPPREREESREQRRGRPRDRSDG